MAVESLHEKITPHLHLSEIRTINADDFWLSPFYKQRCTAIHFTWKQEPEAIRYSFLFCPFNHLFRHLIGLIEEKLKPFKVRPHWGKLFTFSHEYLASIYEKLPDFQRLLNKYDPNGKFRNRFIDTYVFGDDNKN
jgi:alditol oxidase